MRVTYHASSMATLLESHQTSDLTRGCVLFVGIETELSSELASMLADLKFFLCPTARSADEALHHARTHKPDLVLVETRLVGDSDGVMAASKLHQELGLRVIYLVADTDLSSLERANQTFPYGYVLKPIRPADLRCCLELALHYRLLERRPSVRASIAPSLQTLSTREIEVLKLIARGYTIKDIAKALKIATPTVNTYRQRLTDKLALKSRTELVSFAAAAGLLQGSARASRRPGA